MLTSQFTTYLRLSPREIVMGIPLTETILRSVPPAKTPVATGDARGAFRRTIRRLMDEGPVFVAFSGGRDSSAVLAVAASVAREHGTPPPVPITYRFPGDENASEDEWQDLVLRHLGITERVVLEVTDQHRILGPLAQESMAARGLVWPASVTLDHEMYSLVRGGTLLTGEGGDILLKGRRSAPVARLRRTVHRRQRPDRRLLHDAVKAGLAQQAALRETAEQTCAEGAPWLRGRTREQFIETVIENSAEPFRWDRAVRTAALQPHARGIFHNLDLVAKDYDVRIAHPLLAPEFVGAWMGDGGRLGVTGRTVSMRRLFADVLPERVLGRSTKAFFNASRVGPGERAFARRWDGRGLDLTDVDVAVLRHTWEHAERIGRSDIALMAAWMASEGLPLEGPAR